MKALRNEQGFTLIELMVVVLIIGILVAVAVPVFVNASANAKLRTCQANLRTLDGAAQTYQADTQVDLTNYNDLIPKYIKLKPKCTHGAAPADYTFTAATSAAAASFSCPHSHTY